MIQQLPIAVASEEWSAPRSLLWDHDICDCERPMGLNCIELVNSKDFQEYIV